jgi:tripartite-type tricarboxylate transporter receptor subunit TctC
MSAPRSRRRRIGLLASTLLLAALPAAAQQYPTRPIKIVVPYAPGGTDLEVRALAGVLEKELGQPIQVEIREGGGSTIGANYVAKGSTADGYTLLYINSTGVTVAPLMRKLPYVADDLRPVAQTTSNAHLLAIRSDLPYKTLSALIAYAKAHPGEIVFGSTGNGSGAHLAGEAFFDRADIKVNHIPFNGIGASVTAAVGGNVDMIIGYPIAIMPHVTAGKLLPIAQFSAERSPLLPDVPTLKETGVDLVIDIHTGVFAPKRTPDAVVARLSDAFKVAAAAPGFKSFGEQSWTVPFYRPTAEFAHEIEPEKTMYDKVIARLGTR